MTYATAAQVTSEFKHADFTATSKVTTDKLGEILEEVDAEIDNYLSARYSLPITDASALVFLRKIALDIATFRLAKILNIKDSKTLPDGRIMQDISNGSVYAKTLRTLEALRDGKTILKGAAMRSNNAEVRSYTQENNTPHKFTMDKEMW